MLFFYGRIFPCFPSRPTDNITIIIGAIYIIFMITLMLSKTI